MTLDTGLPPEPDSSTISRRTPPSPTRIFLRGMAVSLPAILTVVILLWVAKWIHTNIISPATWIVTYSIASWVDNSVDVKTLASIEAAPPIPFCDTTYLVTPAVKRDYQSYLRSVQPPAPAFGETYTSVEQRRSEWMQIRAERVPTPVFVPLGPRAVPYDVYVDVARSLPPGQVPAAARSVYMEYVAIKYFQSAFLLSALTVVLIIVVFYFVGRFVSVRLGGWIVHKFEEQVLGRLPVIRNVYGSVKQVTDFVFSENQQVEYRRVCAVEYPRRGMWIIGFVTGESMLDLAVTNGEPCVSILIPTSPMPMTGFTVSVPRSDILDLNITVEQAMQFCISCGVLTPPQQRLTPEMLQRLIKMGVLKNSSSQQVPNTGVVPKLEATASAFAERSHHGD